MPKSLLALIAWVPSLWNPAWGQSPTVRINEGIVKQPNGSSRRNQGGDADKRGTKELPFVVDTEGHQNTDHERAEADAEKQHVRKVESDTLFYARLTAWATAFLVMVGIGGTIAALCTLRAINRQVKVMVGSERAWVLADIGPIPDMGPIIPNDRIPLGSNSLEIFWVFPTIKNYGRTTARLVRMAITSRLIPEGEQLPQVPSHTGPGFDVKLDAVLAPEGTPLRPRVGLSRTDLNIARETGQTLYIYGLIEYTDIGGIKRRSAYCFFFAEQGGFNPNKTGFYPAFEVPPAYIECT